jgi:NAD(P)-dependent dehydrogenase (short-subunit alcohol dehydrogenase family)
LREVFFADGNGAVQEMKRTALVIGASRGFGSAIALELASFRRRKGHMIVPLSSSKRKIPDEKRTQVCLAPFKLTISALILSAPVAGAQSGNLASYVNPMVGTNRGGDTFPGAVASFGSVQMNPNWAGVGYRYRNTQMHGFAVNSMSGPGGTDEGQVLEYLYRELAAVFCSHGALQSLEHRR